MSFSHRSYRAIPNVLTISRSLLCPLIVYLVLSAQFLLSLVLFIITCLTDFLDGYLARRWDASTKLGRVLDPLSDKVLTISFFALLLALKVCPAWFLWLIIAVTVFQAIGLLVVWTAPWAPKSPFSPLKIGKWNTALQFAWIGCLLVTFVAHRKAPNPYAVTDVWVHLGYLVLGLIQVVVFLSYLIRSGHVLAHFPFAKLRG